MNFLHSEIGSAKDNTNSPIHNWYKFTAGFSHKFVDEIIKSEQLLNKEAAKVFDPFAGCGTTLVSAQKVGILAVGNEAQNFMYDIIRAKLNWKLGKHEIAIHIKGFKNYISANRKQFDLKENAHALLLTLYTPATLKTLYLLKEYIQELPSYKHRLFFKLALSQTLHKVSLHPIAVPYIVRSKFLTSKASAWRTFNTIVEKMQHDSISLKDTPRNAEIYLHDSRLRNPKVKANSCDICITSPPYLNNLDYGEVSKVHTHFFGITESWSDITNKVRKKLVTGATTHYTDSAFSLNRIRNTSFYKKNKLIVDNLIKRHERLKKIGSVRLGRKSFHILMILYFKDMYKVLLEIRRVLKPGAKAYLILGDSAPYGMRIPTTQIIGKIALNTGFSQYKIHRIRSRGIKWKSLTHRHSLELSENVLILS
ncbi:MAG TPA: hypothetical protein VGM30_04845 [Puia sp.]|jgi:DNA modification methylase